jgi:hypothetical protein
MLQTGGSTVEIWFPGVSNDTVFTTVVTISIFVLGYLLNRLYDAWIERKKQNDVQKFVLFSLEAILPAIDKQVASFNSVRQQMASKQHQDYIYTESTSLNFEGLDSLPRVEVFHAFARGRKKKRIQRIEHLNTIWGAIDFIRHQKESSRQTFLQFNEQYRRYLINWNENVDAIARIHDEYLMMATQAKLSPRDDPFFKEFNLIVHRLAEVGKSWEREKTQLLGPLLDVCKTHYADARAVTVMKKILQAEYAYDNREHLLNSFGAYFDQQASGLTEKKKSIINEIHFFRGKIATA